MVSKAIVRLVSVILLTKYYIFFQSHFVTTLYSKCWTDYEGYTTFLAVPVIAVMVSNVAILISVIVTITRKRTIRQSEDRYVTKQ